MEGIFTFVKGEKEKMLIDAETGEIIISGDSQDDGVDHQVEGFSKALDFFEYGYIRN